MKPKMEGTPDPAQISPAQLHNKSITMVSAARLYPGSYLVSDWIIIQDSCSYVLQSLPLETTPRWQIICIREVPQSCLVEEALIEKGKALQQDPCHPQYQSSIIHLLPQQPIRSRNLHRLTAGHMSVTQIAS